MYQERRINREDQTILSFVKFNIVVKLNKYRYITYLYLRAE
jgi:hypothetical protein